MHFIYIESFNQLYFNFLNMKFFLIGYMGSGKSTLGKALAAHQNISFIDLDHYIELREKDSVKQIFEKKGEIYFRKKEMEYLDELLQSDESFVLSLGGGTPCFGNNMQKINSVSDFVFYLQYAPQSLATRLAPQKQHRPLIAHLDDEALGEFIAKHLFDRNPYYMQAKYIINMNGLSAGESLQRIIEIIQKNK